MKKYSFLLLLLVSLLILSACGQNPSPPPVPDEGKKGTSGITLKIGEEIKLEKSGWTLRLNAVTADSRCPTTVECFHAGWVTVDISVEEGGDQTDQFLLTIPADREGQSSQATVGDTTIRLMEVNPYPTVPGGLPQDEYVVKLEIVD